MIIMLRKLLWFLSAFWNLKSSRAFKYYERNLKVGTFKVFCVSMGYGFILLYILLFKHRMFKKFC